MAALTDRKRDNPRGATIVALPIEDTEEIFPNSIVSLLLGRVRAYQATAGEVIVGRSINTASRTGNTAGTEEVEVDLEKTILGDEAVTGLTGIPQIGQRVYAVDDAGTYTLTPTGAAVGEVIRFLVAGRGDVLLYSYDARKGSPTTRETMYLGSYDATSLTGDIATAIELRGTGRIVDVFALIDVAPAGAGGDADVNLEIGGVNLTGGVVEILTGDARAAKKNGTAITALNNFRDGDLLDVEMVQNVAITSGRFQLFATIERP